MKADVPILPPTYWYFYKLDLKNEKNKDVTRKVVSKFYRIFLNYILSYLSLLEFKKNGISVETVGATRRK